MSYDLDDIRLDEVSIFEEDNREELIESFIEMFKDEWTQHVCEYYSKMR